MGKTGITPPEARAHLAAQHIQARTHARERSPRQRVRLALLRRLGLLWRGSETTREPSEISSILVIRPDHLGDLLFTTPALRRLRITFPAARITGLVGPWGEAVLAHNPCLDEVLTCPFPGFQRAPKRSWIEPYRILWYHGRALHRRRYDLAIILRFDHWWGALLAAVARIPQRVGYDIAEVQPALTQAVPYVMGRHEVLQNLALVDAATGRVPPREADWRENPLEFAISADDDAWAQAYLRQEAVRWIAIHPGAGAAVKQWRVEAWANVGNALAERTGAHILLTGSGTERPLADEIARRLHTPARVAAGETTIGQLAALLRRASLAIGPDSGPLHLAVAVGTPTVHLYGPVDVGLFGPWGDPARHRVVISDWACVPCNRLDYAEKELPLHGCLRDISVEDVIAAAEEAVG